MKALFMSAALAAVLAAPSALAAKKEKVVFVEASAVADKPVVTLDTTKAYVMLRSDIAVPLHLMRVPDAEDQAKYDQLRADSLTEAKEKYVRKARNYERDMASWEKYPKGSARPPKPEKPVEPTDGNFEFVPFGLMTGVSIGPLFRFSKGSGGDKVSTYVHQLTPGTYRIYGMMSVVPGGGAFGSCFCMGSVKFEVKAGEITDLGRFVARELPKRDSSDNAMPMPLGVEYRLPVAGEAADSRLAALPVRPAKLKPVGKLPNYFGMTIDRFPATAGVIRYDRDKIVDLTAGN
ncbi:hypothetical protein [Sphingomonas sp. J315]|uniref:hypothetical protein n=1 Tax=Sphingomonas sp. J315 TaxID=2898433 RepID=UPI0021AD74D4|nr:hypothetical protein [Sphingomonas sp. J315]UUX99697.1 hypothetical protein LRS08_00520 [Sphingomonas sp. J315]